MYILYWKFIHIIPTIKLVSYWLLGLGITGLTPELGALLWALQYSKETLIAQVAIRLQSGV